jgi:sulfatase-like protein/HEAT repeat protein
MNIRSLRILSWLVDAAAVLVVWTGALIAETVVLGLVERDQFSGIWEIALARRAAVPLATAGLTPAALVVAAAWRMATSRSRAASRLLATCGTLAGGALAWGVSGGRHFANPELRIAFVVTISIAAAFASVFALRPLSLLRRRPMLLAMQALILAIASWLADAYVLPRLYPAFHIALLVATLIGAALLAFAVRCEMRPYRVLSRIGAALVAALVIESVAKVPRSLSELERATNLRILLVEHAPLLGPTVVVAMRLHPPHSNDSRGEEGRLAPAEVARSLAWSDRDVILLTVDALRADHVSAYGYARATTPNIDALAREGTLFVSAYCPTPHTSYSITSMMTGKYLRPLLALGLGKSSETWAQYMRRYGWRTAAFYPPAVFFIDEEKFNQLEEDHLGFEYAKVEFADPPRRERQVAEYLETATLGRPMFLWVHFFEPHEPYVAHSEYSFSGGRSADIDAYDSEVATADDGIGRIVRLLRARRPGAVIIVTADHGEEFGEHGGRYHGTTVYEEQVRVPLVIAGPGVRADSRVSTVVQTIDLLPTVLSAIGIPRPARVRGRDLGPVLAGDTRALDAGFAFAETDDYALVAVGADRFVCQRRAAACALYRPADDPLERRDVGTTGERGRELRALLRATEAGHGRYETTRESVWPEALRRGLQGEADAAIDVAALLDDADPSIRRKAAEVCFALHVPETAEKLKKSLRRDDDDVVQRWDALALTRLASPAVPLAESLLRDSEPNWRRPAALALAERGDPRACDELAAWWDEVVPTAVPSDNGQARLTLDLAHAQELLAATRTARCRSSVPELIRALEDVRARPFVADALGALGDERARAPLLGLLADEPYVTTRPHEARALLALGAHEWASESPVVNVVLAIGIQKAARVIVLQSAPGATSTVIADGRPALPVITDGEVQVFDLPTGPTPGTQRVRLELRVTGGGVLAVWLAPIGRLD